MMTVGLVNTSEQTKDLRMGRFQSLFHHGTTLINSLIFGHEYAARRLGVTIGNECRIYSLYFGTEPWLVQIGDRVTITSGVRFLTHDGSTCLIKDEAGRRFRYARIKIDSDVFIGINSIIMPGVHIGNQVVVGAGTVITKSVPAGLVVAGNPARVITTFEKYHQRVIATCPSAKKFSGSTYRQRIDSVVESEARPMMSI